MKHNFLHMENLEFQEDSYICPYRLKKLKNGKVIGIHGRSHFMKINKTLLTCDLLKDVPYSWSNTKKRTNHITTTNYEHHIEEKQNLFLDGDKDLLVFLNDQHNSFSTNLPIKKRKAQESNDDVQDENETRKSLKKIEVIKLEERHICNICSKSFKSHQALGGHKSHHGRSQKFESIECKGKSYDKIHQCCYCSKIFPKGQALGGHKRHCIKGKNIFPPLEADIKLLSLDLNELPPHDDEGNQEIPELCLN